MLELYGALTPVLMTLPDDGEYEQLAADIVQSWEQSTPGNRWLDLDFGLELCGRSEAADQAHGDAIGSRVLEMEDDELVTKWLADNSERLPRHFRDGLLLRLAGALVSRSEPDFAKAEKIAAGLAGPDREGAYKRACITALKASRWRDAERCLARAGRAGGEEAMRIATDCLADEHDSGGSKAKLLSFIISNQDRFDLAGRHQMAHQLVAYMIDGRQLVAGMGKKVGEIRVEDSPLRLELAKRLAEAADQQEAPRRKQHFLLAAAGLAGSDHRARQPVEERIAKLRASDDLADRRAAAEIDKQVPPISE